MKGRPLISQHYARQLRSHWIVVVVVVAAAAAAVLEDSAAVVADQQIHGTDNCREPWIRWKRSRHWKEKKTMRLLPIPTMTTVMPLLLEKVLYYCDLPAEGV